MSERSRSSRASKLILAVLFLLALAGTSIWVVRSFLGQEDKTVIVLPKEVAKPKPPQPQRQPQQPAFSGPAIGGQVINEAGKPIPNVRLNISFMPPPAANVPRGQRQRIFLDVQTNGQGRWSTTEVPREAVPTLRMTLTQHNYATLYVPNPPPAPNTLLDQTAQLTMQRGLDVSGVVVNDAGLPLIGARVTVGRNTGGNDGIPTATTNTEGKFVLHHLVSGQPSPLVATLTDFAPAGLVVNAAAGAPPVRLVMTTGRTMHGTVKDPQGKPIEGAQVTLTQWLNTFWLVDNSATTDSQGHYYMARLPADGFQIRVTKGGFNDTTIALAPGDSDTQNIGLFPQITLRGQVTDATTQQPISKFTVVTGAKFSGSQEPRFDNSTAANFTNGRFRQTLTGFTGNIDQWFVRIDAPGYAPLVSPPIPASGRQDFQLTPSAGIAGHILNADGTPAAGIAVGVALTRETVQIDAGQIQRDHLAVTTDAKGKFQLPDQTGKFIVMAAGPAGYAVADQDDIAKSTEIHLVAWAKVSGKLMIGSKVGANEPVGVEALAGYKPSEPFVRVEQNRLTDAQGNFEFDVAPSGRIRVSREIGPRADLPTASEFVTVAPGGSITVNIGGAGRPVVGRVIIPPEFVAGNGRALTLSVDGPDRSYSAVVGDDGSFKIDDVLPGGYRLRATAFLSRVGPPLNAFASTNFTVESIPGGRSDEPLQLPDLALKMRMR